jgi:RHS repeat-associated protein
MLDMKNLIRSLIAYTLCNSLVTIGACVMFTNLCAAENGSNLTAQISSSPIFYQNLMWVGDAPPREEENRALWAEMENMAKNGVEPTLPALEKFIADHPASPWVPALRANLARYYREHGRYTRALENWELAWKATHEAKDGAAKKIADFTFAHWTRLLGSLGRMDTLGSLFQQTRDRSFDSGPLEQIINGTKEGYRDMLTQPGICFNCGTYALINVGKTLNGPKFDTRLIESIPSPKTGFNFSRLKELADQSSLDLVPVQWGAVKELVVPSVIHWKQDHFAAILEQKDGLYRVVDPTFEHQSWLRASEIREEASGFFMVQKKALPEQWRVLAAAETDRIFGRGRSSGIGDGDDGCANNSGGGGSGSGSGTGGAGAPDSGGSGSFNGPANPAGTCTSSCSGNGDGGDKHCDNPCSSGPGGLGGNSGFGGGAGGLGGGAGGLGGMIRPGVAGAGMPVWKVSEPYISVFLYDKPLWYSPGIGYPINFTLAYKQRESQALSGVYSFGTMWDSSWLTYITFSGDNDPAPIMTVAGGGHRTSYNINGTNEFFSFTSLGRNADGQGHTINFVITHPDGAKDCYGYLAMLGMSQVAFLTAQVDPYGHSNRFIYIQTNSAILLKYVVDADGRTNTLTYTNALLPSQVTGVTDPFGRTAIIRYDAFGKLTNIVDVAGISNVFTYGVNNWIDTMTTPYGTTSFTHYTNNTVFNGTNEFGGDPDVNYGDYYTIRGVRIVDPDGGVNVYTLRQNCLNLTNPVTGNLDSFLGVFMPNQPSVPTTAPYSDNDHMQYRNSFHWGPRQAAGLTNDFQWFSISDHLKARRRQWFHDFSSLNISQSIHLDQEPSPDGVTPGHAIWYDYNGKELGYTGVYGEGTNSAPSSVAYVLDELGSAFTRYKWFVRDSWGRPTQIADTYSTEAGESPLTRTNSYLYDLNGNLTIHNGPRGENIEGYAWDSHHLLRATNAVGDVWYYTYDSQGRLININSPSGLNTTNIYFATGDYTNWVQTRIDLEIGRTNTFTYTNDLVASVTDERGVTTSYTYDNLQRVTSITDSRGTISNIYSKLDLVKVLDRMGYTNSFEYDNVRRLIGQTNALGRFTRYNYCNCGALDSIRDAEGNYTYFFYDNAGRMTNTVYADGYSVTNNFDFLSRVGNTADSAGYRVTNWFNNQGLRYAVTTVAGNKEFIDFDDEDRATNMINSEGVSTAMTYDNLGRLRTRAQLDGIESLGYSAAGLVAYTNQIGMTNFYAYDAAGRKTFETNANQELIRYTNNAAGDLLSLTDGKGQTTCWKYDQYGRVTNKLDQVGLEILRYKYDANNRLTNRWSAAKANTYYAYDPVGNLTNVDYPSSVDVKFAYDAMNRMTNMVDGAGTTKYTYSPAGQLLTEDGPFASDTVTNAYWNRSRTNLSLQQPTGVWTNAFAYDAVKRLTQVTSPAGSVGYVYDPTLFTHHASLLTLPNTSYITNAFDANARLIATYLANSGNTVLDSYTYVYNPANQRTNLTRADASTVAYEYDSIGQLKVADSSVSTEDRGYTYDTAWNLNYRTNNASLSSFYVNVKNELTNRGGFLMTYDSNGNLTSFGGYIVYTYDDENRLTQLLDSVYHSYQTLFTYDGLGRLRKRTEYTWGGTKWLVSSNVEYIYDGWRVIQERDGSNNPLVSYTRGNDLSGSMEGAGGIGGLLARSSGYSGGNFTSHAYYFADGNGNVTYMLNSSQAMVASYRYDPFGNIISTSGTLAGANVYRFSSKEFHANSGMYYYGYRFYDPNLQRWINRDPIGEPGFEITRSQPISQLGDGPNSYSFVHNKPSNFIDSDGLAIALPIPIGLPPIILENPIGASLCAGAILGAGLCYAFPDAMTKPGELVGRVMCKPKKMKSCSYTCVIQENGGRTRTVQKTVSVAEETPCPQWITGPGVSCSLNK